MYPVVALAKPATKPVLLVLTSVAKGSRDVAVTVAELLTYPVLVVVIVAVELVLPDTPVTVTSPLPLIATEPDAVAVPAHVYKAE